MKIRALAALASLALLTTSTALAASRQVVIRVVDERGNAVAGALVRIAADEMDAVGTTDTAGRVVVTTTSAAVTATAEKGEMRTTATSAAATISLRLAGGDQ
jgi:hypothetical protein